MEIFIGADHGGFKLKEELRVFLIKNGYNVFDKGAFELNPDDDYPDFASEVAKEVSNQNNEEDWQKLGILICRSGNGMCIAANKFKNVYAALAFSEKHAEMARKDDNANVLCLDAEYEGADPMQIALTFLTTKFAGLNSRHGRRFGKIKKFESDMRL